MTLKTSNRRIARTHVPAAPRASIGRSTALLLAGLTLLALYSGWDWLVATGVATLLIAVAPCLVMCGLGLCMHRFAGRNCEKSEGSSGGDAE